MVNNQPGYDAESFGLLKKAFTNSDPKYTAVANLGGITLYALHPKYFNQDGVQHLYDVFNSIDTFEINTSVYVKNVGIKGFVTTQEFNTESLEFCPVTVINNPFSGKNPYDYASQLKSGTADNYATFYLNYGVTIEPFQLDIRDLPYIELNADTTITVRIGDVTITRPLQHLLDPARGVDPILTVAPGDQTATGFWFTGDFAGRNFGPVKYNGNFTQSAVVSAYRQHMMQNANREQALENSSTYQTAMSVLGSITDGFNVFGGIGSVMDALFEWGLRDSMFEDMKNQLTNVGGDIIHNPIGQDIDTLVTITYPIRKKVKATNTSSDTSYFYPANFDVNKIRTFEVNRQFPDLPTALNYLQNTYKVTIATADIEPMIEYGQYNNYFKRIISLGGLE